MEAPNQLEVSFIGADLSYNLIADVLYYRYNHGYSQSRYRISSVPHRHHLEFHL